MEASNTPEVRIADMVADWVASGIHLDIGCGESKQPDFIGMDKRALPGVDIVHDLEAFPYPLPDECCRIILGSHIVEHIKPWLMIDFMDELWRIMRPGGEVMFSHPYGVSSGFVQDPTHCNPCNEATWMYFCPEQPGMLGGGESPLYGIYKPKPWRVKDGTFSWHLNGNMEIVLVKVEVIKYHCEICGFSSERPASSPEPKCRCEEAPDGEDKA